MSTVHGEDSLKSIRETLCLAQSAINHWPTDQDRKQWHVGLLGRLINDIDRQRPLGSNGKHGNRHTKTCGCDDVDRGNWWARLWAALTHKAGVIK